ncbi:MAG: YhcB family protein [Psychrobium sp.]|nr:YhcB family protein [Psychrobium sp.]
MDITIAILLVAVGIVVGFITAKLTTKTTDVNQQEVAKSEQLEAELTQYKQDVEQHFSSSAELLNSMAQEYSKVYQHMAQAQQNLLPDSELIIKIPFKDVKEPSQVTETINEVELQALAANDILEAVNKQPNDYAAGSHGIINQVQATPADEKASA